MQPKKNTETWSHNHLLTTLSIFSADCVIWLGTLWMRGIEIVSAKQFS